MTLDTVPTKLHNTNVTCLLTRSPNDDDDDDDDDDS